jgi:uncharacterized protein (TIGR00156 family)
MRPLVLRTLLLLFLPLGLATTSVAQFVGPGASNAPTTVQSILDNPQDDQTVTLRGILLEKVGHEKYAFSDDTGQIRIEIDDDVFPPQRITPDMTIEIYGEIEKDFLRSPEVDVERVTVVESTSGT